MKKMNLLSALLLCVGFTAVSAQEFKPGYYGIAVAGPTTETLGAVKLGGNGYQIGGGYEFNKNAALEVTYGNAIKIQTATSTSSVNYNMTSLFVNGLFRFPVSESLVPLVSFGRVSGTESISVTGNGTASSASATGARTIYGAGFEIPLEARTSFRLHTQSTTSRTNYATIKSTTAGLIFKF
ncbi:MAG: outer membrane protein beta-barrel domain [Bacteroidota bacterium]|jgi:hypothetical protein